MVEKTHTYEKYLDKCELVDALLNAVEAETNSEVKDRLTRERIYI